MPMTMLERLISIAKISRNHHFDLRASRCPSLSCANRPEFLNGQKFQDDAMVSSSSLLGFSIERISVILLVCHHFRWFSSCLRNTWCVSFPYFAILYGCCRLIRTCRRSPRRLPVLPAEKRVYFRHDDIEEERQQVHDRDEEERQQARQANHVESDRRRSRGDGLRRRFSRSRRRSNRDRLVGERFR